MQASNEYIQLLKDIKGQISKSRFVAARLVNHEQLKLYFAIGLLLDTKIALHSWGDKIILQVSSDLNAQMPGLRGFSYRSLNKMRQFYQAYASESIGPLVTAQLQIADNLYDATWKATTAKLKPTGEFIIRSPTSQSEDATMRSFLGLTFTHHLVLLNKCKVIRRTSILHATCLE